MYSVMCPNRVRPTDLWINLIGSADTEINPQAIYLANWNVLDWNELSVKESLWIEMSYGNGALPANIGIDGKPWVNYTPAYIHLMFTSPLPQGDYTIRLEIVTISPYATSLEGGERQVILIPIFITQPPIRLIYPKIPIPGLNRWRDQMIILGNKWAPGIEDPTEPWGDATWYWDMAGAMWDCSEYIGGGGYKGQSNVYHEAALGAARSYKKYLEMNNGQPAVWAVYPRGLRMTYERTQDGSWIDAIKGMTAGGWVAVGGNPDPSSMRETAFACDTWRELWFTEAADSRMLDRSVNFLLGQFNLLYVQQYGKGEGMVNEPMFFGAAAQALTDYFDMVDEDERIPESLIAATQYIWQRAVNGETGYTLYDIFDPNSPQYTGLNTMMTNAWGFLYKLTGDQMYREQGDILFSHVFDDGNFEWSPKQFSQIYHRSIDYVTRWRA